MESLDREGVRARSTVAYLRFACGVRSIEDLSREQAEQVRLYFRGRRRRQDDE